MASKKKSTPAKKAAPAKKKSPAKKKAAPAKTPAKTKKSVSREEIKALTGVVAPPAALTQPEPVLAKPRKKSLFRRLFPKKTSHR
jgi:hypothetical protein